uniref:Rabphilin 3A-like (without C2 domains) n=1 Tax=Astyanax mexicanus TaxID=7994 RepID=W5KJD8_ASTMX
MTDTMFGSGNSQWVCPNDRQLTLRAKLHTGWSVHTFQSEKQRKSQALDKRELDIILSVIHRAEQLELIEQHRIGRLIERLENMRRSAVGNGLSQCLLCGEALGLLGTPSVLCLDCCKKVCTKCGIEMACSQKRAQWLCKICSEQREVWKRSGAWFYKALPKHIRPVSDPLSHIRRPLLGREDQPVARSVPVTYTWAHSKGQFSNPFWCFYLFFIFYKRFVPQTWIPRHGSPHTYVVPYCVALVTHRHSSQFHSGVFNSVLRLVACVLRELSSTLILNH